MLARWRPCSTTSGELYRRYCANKKENAGRVTNYLRTMGTIWKALSRPKVMMMGQIVYLDAYGPQPSLHLWLAEGLSAAGSRQLGLRPWWRSPTEVVPQAEATLSGA